MSLNVNTFNAPVAAMLDTAAFNALFVQPAFDMTKIRAPTMAARGDQWTGKHLWSMSGHHEPKADKQPLIGLGLGWPVGQTFTSFIQEMKTLPLDPHSLDFLITPPLRSLSWTRTISALNPEATAFVPGSSTPNSKTSRLNPKATAFDPRRSLNPRATEFIPRAASQSTLSQVTPRRTRFPRAPRMVAPSVSEGSWDCAEFMDTLASCGLFEEFEAHSQSDELTSELDPSAEEFVPGWTDTSIEAAPREPVRSTAMRRRTTKRGVRGTLQPQVSEETWDSAEFMDSLERYDSYEDAVARIQSDNYIPRPSPFTLESTPCRIKQLEATPDNLPRSVPMARSSAVCRSSKSDPPHRLAMAEIGGAYSRLSSLMVQDLAVNESQDGEWTGCHTDRLSMGSNASLSSESSIQSNYEGVGVLDGKSSTSNLFLWIYLSILLLVILLSPVIIDSC